MAIDLPPALLAIQAVEDAFAAAIRASAIGSLLRQVDTLPGDLSPDEAGDRLRLTPGAFIAFTGGAGLPSRRAGIDARFTVYMVTGQGPAEEQRRRGTTVTVGAYSLLQALVTALHSTPLPPPSINGTPVDGLDIGTPNVLDVGRYWSEAVDKLGLSIYGATFSLTIGFPPTPDVGDISDFAVMNAEIAVNGVPEGGDSPPLPIDDVASQDVIVLVAEEDAELDAFILDADTLS